MRSFLETPLIGCGARFAAAANAISALRMWLVSPFPKRFALQAFFQFHDFVSLFSFPDM
jgi:hypothetical protein